MKFSAAERTRHNTGIYFGTCSGMPLPLSITLAVIQSEQSGRADQSEHTGLIRRWGDTGPLTEHFRQRVNRDVQYEKMNVFLEH